MAINSGTANKIHILIQIKRKKKSEENSVWEKKIKEKKFPNKFKNSTSTIGNLQYIVSGLHLFFSLFSFQCCCCRCRFFFFACSISVARWKNNTQTTTPTITITKENCFCHRLHEILLLYALLCSCFSLNTISAVRSWRFYSFFFIFIFWFLFLKVFLLWCESENEK